MRSAEYHDQAILIQKAIKNWCCLAAAVSGEGWAGQPSGSLVGGDPRLAAPGTSLTRASYNSLSGAEGGGTRIPRHRAAVYLDTDRYRHSAVIRSFAMIG